MPIWDRRIIIILRGVQVLMSRDVVLFLGLRSARDMDSACRTAVVMLVSRAVEMEEE